MASVNKVMLIGNLGGDPELKYTQSGTAVCSFSIATKETWGTGDKKEEKTEWHKIVAWSKLAKICGEYLKKGSPVYIEGRLQTRSWDDKDGIKRYTTEVVVSSMQMLGSNKQGNTSTGSQEEAPPPSDEHIPF